MFNGLATLGNFIGFYSGSPLVAAVSSAATCRVGGRPVPCEEAFSFLGPMLAIIAPMIVLIMLLGLAACVLMIVAWWKVFQKAGRPGWAAIVPIYNIVVMLQIVGMSPWLVLVMFIPGVGSLALFIVLIFVNIKLAKSFGKEDGFAVGLILLPIVFVPILAFGQARFNGIPPAPSQNPPVSPTNPNNSTGPVQTNLADQNKPTNIV